MKLSELMEQGQKVLTNYGDLEVAIDIDLIKYDSHNFEYCASSTTVTTKDDEIGIGNVYFWLFPGNKL